MSKEDLIQLKAVVTQTLPNATFKVKLETGQEVMATISGKIRMHYVKILCGDSVNVEMTPYDLSKARIVYRFKPGFVDKKKVV